MKSAIPVARDAIPVARGAISIARDAIYVDDDWIRVVARNAVCITRNGGNLLLSAAVTISGLFVRFLRPLCVFSTCILFFPFSFPDVDRLNVTSQ